MKCHKLYEFFKKNINIYYLDGTFYVIGLVRMPPIGLRGKVPPLFTSSNRNLEELAKARKGWDGEKGKVWKNAKKLWHIFWEGVEVNGKICYIANIPSQSIKA